MIAQGAFAVEPWALRETYLDLPLLAQAESVFAPSRDRHPQRAGQGASQPDRRGRRRIAAR